MAVDPGISEWGNPPRGRRGIPTSREANPPN